MQPEFGDIKKIAQLAQLALPTAAIPDLNNDLTKILTFIEKINSVNTDGIESLAHPCDERQPLRDDKVTETDQRDKLQALATKTANGLYLVPKVIDRE